jgi:hypothetical protein
MSEGILLLVMACYWISGFSIGYLFGGFFAELRADRSEDAERDVKGKTG